MECSAEGTADAVVTGSALFSTTTRCLSTLPMRFTPSGVSSNAQARSSAMGKPMMSSMMVSVSAQGGRCRGVSTATMTWTSSHATTA